MDKVICTSRRICQLEANFSRLTIKQRDLIRKSNLLPPSCQYISTPIENFGIGIQRQPQQVTLTPWSSLTERTASTSHRLLKSPSWTTQSLLAWLTSRSSMMSKRHCWISITLHSKTRADRRTSTNSKAFSRQSCPWTSAQMPSESAHPTRSRNESGVGYTSTPLLE